MKSFLALILSAATVFTCSLRAATPEQEKEFVAAYRKALEAGDEKALASFLYTEGADAETVGFIKMMQQPEPGAKIKSVELVVPTAEEMAKFNKPMTMPDGKSYVMPVKPIKQLVIKTETKSDSGSSTGSSKSPVAEVKGKLVIPVPVPQKK